MDSFGMHSSHHDVKFSTPLRYDKHSTHPHRLVTIATRKGFSHTADKVLLSCSTFDLDLKHLQIAGVGNGSHSNNSPFLSFPRLLGH